jgi:hypothetical protein
MGSDWRVLASKVASSVDGMGAGSINQACLLQRFSPESLFCATGAIRVCSTMDVEVPCGGAGALQVY